MASASIFRMFLAACLPGSSLFSAMVNGEQALAAHLELLAQEGEEIPGGSVTADEDIAVVSCFLVDIELH